MLQSIYYETLGCKLNQLETESLAHAFLEQGFPVWTAEQNAPPVLAILNTCTVTGKAEQKARRILRLLLRKFPKAPLIVTGCYAEVEREQLSLLDPRLIVFPGLKKGELTDLPSFIKDFEERFHQCDVEQAVRTFCTHHLQEKTSEQTTFRLATTDFLFHSRASIKIQDGCNNKCTYCKIRFARGKSVSLDSRTVIERIKVLEKEGWGEVVLTGINLSQYHCAEGNFAQLLKLILEQTESIAIRISSLYPERVNSELLPFLAHERVCPHFHLSIQSGSDSILHAMKRPYTASAIVSAIKGLRSVKENPFIACDIITGFPGESEEDFQKTLSLCVENSVTGIHAFPFSARSGTEAYEMTPKIPQRIAGERVAILTTLCENTTRMYATQWVGKTVWAIVERSPPESTEQSVLTENYLSLKINATNLAVGSRIRVTITEIDRCTQVLD